MCDSSSIVPWISCVTSYNFVDCSVDACIYCHCRIVCPKCESVTGTIMDLIAIDYMVEIVID